MGWFLRPPETVEKIVTETVVRYVDVPVTIYKVPALPECANFDFDPDISGMSGIEVISFTARLYQWGSNCSNALATLEQ